MCARPNAGGRLVSIILVCYWAAIAVPAGEVSDGLPTVREATAALEHRAGLIDAHVDADRGKLFLELPPPSGPRGEIGRFLFVEGLLTGLGSNPVGLDRGQLGETRILVFRQVGGRVLAEQVNLGYRAQSRNDAERRAVRQSFATSVLWAGKLAARDPDGRSLVDFTTFLIRDAHGIAGRLEAGGHGSFSLEEERSAVDLESCLVFPENLEFEALLTYAGNEPGRDVRQVTPTPEAITLVQHHSILRLPESGYAPRGFDPRAGSFAIRFLDYAAALGQPLEQRWIVRHRLEKIRSGKAPSPVHEPLVYYVDSGAPEPVRSALMDGARWWSRAFEAAGFIDAFQVRLLPEDAHPLDARYNVIQWVHRSTRGWSYGGGVVDPRTGEMIKGHVSLGSLRVRQDRLLFEGLAGTDKTGSGDRDDPIELALARIRQLSAHEVGHTLGLAHNFAASTYGRASVMDYPAPLIRVDGDGKLDLSDAYAVGVGEWDVHAIRYAYSAFDAEADTETELRKIVEAGLERGLVFLTDPDARPAGAAHPLANLWDNGADPVAELEHMLRVRRIALDSFGERNIASGRPLALLQEVLAPLYFGHRYQLDAAAKTLGGLDYRYAIRGDGQPAARPVDAARQLRALEVLLGALEPEQLDLPESILRFLLPRPAGHLPNRELFRGNTSPAFDGLAAAATAAELVVNGLLQTERAARLVDQQRRDASMPGFDAVLAALIDRAFRPAATAGEPRLAAVGREVQQVVVASLLRLSANDSAPPAVRANADQALAEILRRTDRAGAGAAADTAHDRYVSSRIRRYLERPFEELAPAAPSPPPGSPIGDPGWSLGACSHPRP